MAPNGQVVSGIPAKPPVTKLRARHMRAQPLIRRIVESDMLGARCVRLEDHRSVRTTG